jgi:hypothetical protein
MITLAGSRIVPRTASDDASDDADDDDFASNRSQTPPSASIASFALVHRSRHLIGPPQSAVVVVVVVVNNSDGTSRLEATTPAPPS